MSRASIGTGRPGAGKGLHSVAVPRAESSSPGRRPGLAGVLVVALPVLFLHIDYQPKLRMGLATAKLQDVAVLAIVGAALLAGRRLGFGPLRAGRALWLAAGGLAVWILVSCFLPLATRSGYAWRTHVVTAAEFVEYGLLAPAVPLLLRRRADVSLLLTVLTVWSAVASTVALLQFFGVGIFGAWPAGYRQPAFLGHHDLAALSGAVVLAGLASLVADVPRFPARLALASGTLGLVLAGASAGVIGLLLAAAALALVARGSLTARRLAAVAAVCALVTAGVLALRARDFDQFVRFLGIRQEQASTREDVQTYAQRTLLAYIGGRIFLDHPIVGVGWQGSAEDESYRPYLADARRRFPDAAEQAFPSPRHRYGVQNLYVQTLADLGAVGGLALLAVFLAGLGLAARAALAGSTAALLGLLWLVLVVGLWSAQGLVAGIPLDAVTWLALGLAAAGAAATRPASAGSPSSDPIRLPA